jgi:hypothetical protein
MVSEQSKNITFAEDNFAVVYFIWNSIIDKEKYNQSEYYVVTTLVQNSVKH